MCVGMADDKDIAGFLQRKGAVGVLVRLDATDGMLNGELEDQVHVTSSTLSNRLTEGVSEDLLTQTRHPDDHGNAKRYQLTKRGQKVRNKLESQGIDELYDQFFEIHQQLNEETEVVLEWLAESQITRSDWPPDRRPDY